MAAKSIVDIGGSGDAATTAAVIASLVDREAELVNGLWTLTLPSWDELNVWDAQAPAQNRGYDATVFVWRSPDSDADKFEASERAGRELFDLLAKHTDWRLRLRGCTSETLAERAPADA